MLDTEHPIFSSATVRELQQNLDALEVESSPEGTNEASVIMRSLGLWSKIGKGLRLDTKYGLGSYRGKSPNGSGIRVLFDGDNSATGIQWKAVNTFWFEMK